MGMNVGGGSGGPRSEINVTPLVDVVLVLLIIFMIVVPLAQMGYNVNTPPEVKTQQVVPDQSQLIVRLDTSGQIYINKEAVATAQFPARIADVIRNRENKIVFFAADGDLQYDRVAQVVDMMHENGVKNIGIVFDDLKGGGVESAVRQ